jgi:hypothetical protein
MVPLSVDGSGYERIGRSSWFIPVTEQTGMNLSSSAIVAQAHGASG